MRFGHKLMCHTMAIYFWGVEDGPRNGLSLLPGGFIKAIMYDSREITIMNGIGISITVNCFCTSCLSLNSNSEDIEG